MELKKVVWVFVFNMLYAFSLVSSSTTREDVQKECDSIEQELKNSELSSMIQFYNDYHATIDDGWTVDWTLIQSLSIVGLSWIMLWFIGKLQAEKLKLAECANSFRKVDGCVNKLGSFMKKLNVQSPPEIPPEIDFIDFIESDDQEVPIGIELMTERDRDLVQFLFELTDQLRTPILKSPFDPVDLLFRPKQNMRHHNVVIYGGRIIAGLGIIWGVYEIVHKIWRAYRAYNEQQKLKPLKERLKFLKGSLHELNDYQKVSENNVNPNSFLSKDGARVHEIDARNQCALNLSSPSFDTQTMPAMTLIFVQSQSAYNEMLEIKKQKNQSVLLAHQNDFLIEDNDTLRFTFMKEKENDDQKRISGTVKYLLFDNNHFLHLVIMPFYDVLGFQERKKQKKNSASLTISDDESEAAPNNISDDCSVASLELNITGQLEMVNTLSVYLGFLYNSGTSSQATLDTWYQELDSDWYSIISGFLSNVNGKESCAQEQKEAFPLVVWQSVDQKYALPLSKKDTEITPQQKIPDDALVVWQRESILFPHTSRENNQEAKTVFTALQIYQPSLNESNKISMSLPGFSQEESLVNKHQVGLSIPLSDTSVVDSVHGAVLLRSNGVRSFNSREKILKEIESPHQSVEAEHNIITNTQERDAQMSGIPIGSTTGPIKLITHFLEEQDQSVDHNQPLGASMGSVAAGSISTAPLSRMYASKKLPDQVVSQPLAAHDVRVDPLPITAKLASSASSLSNSPKAEVDLLEKKDKNETREHSAQEKHEQEISNTTQKMADCARSTVHNTRLGSKYPKINARKPLKPSSARTHLFRLVVGLMMVGTILILKRIR